MNMNQWLKTALAACIDFVSFGLALILFGVTAGLFVYSLLLLWKKFYV